MSTNAAKNLFIYGSLLCFAVLVILTIDTMGTLDKRAPEITEKVDAGKKVWHKYDCIGCHTILGNGSYFAPDMTKATERKPKGYLKKFLLNPRSIKPDAAMPKLGLSEEEADNLIAFLEWTSKVDTNDWPPKPVLAAAAAAGTASTGQMLFRKNDCAACHQIAGLGGTAGPDLTHTGSKQPDIDWHIRHLKDPASVVENSAMPAFAHLSDEEIRMLAEYLITLK
ncbi:MAG: cytochrome c [Nitrospiraceae bacterium]|nr:MAG: cytochrome c [Nitrospiraceae bacterium]